MSFQETRNELTIEKINGGIGVDLNMILIARLPNICDSKSQHIRDVNFMVTY